ncbi:hypothetical protein HanRHA438_Chr15g0684891 [Helianthus annuus]|nr:hypothetical protein HanRHA438_Chr15g0684891 [Helianthus annuus]
MITFVSSGYHYFLFSLCTLLNQIFGSDCQCAALYSSYSRFSCVELVERAENDWMKIMVVGKVDPIELCENVKAKIKKSVELVSPATKKKNGSGDEQENQQKQQTVAAKDESAHKKVMTTVLKIPIHRR